MIRSGQASVTVLMIRSASLAHGRSTFIGVHREFIGKDHR
jgi:hypothetical protein